MRDIKFFHVLFAELHLKKLDGIFRLWHQKSSLLILYLSLFSSVQERLQQIDRQQCDMLRQVKREIERLEKERQVLVDDFKKVKAGEKICGP